MRYVKIHPNANIIQPNPGDAGYDLCTPEDITIPSILEYIRYDLSKTTIKNIFKHQIRETISPPYIAHIKTGLILEIPDEHVGIISDRGSISMGNTEKNLVGGLKVFGGIVDSGFRGEIVIGLANLSHSTAEFKAGDKIAQILITPIYTSQLKQLDNANDLIQTERGKQGFGSTGR